MYFDSNICENKDGKKLRAVIVFCVTNGEIYLRWSTNVTEYFFTKYMQYITNDTKLDKFSDIFDGSMISILLFYKALAHSWLALEWQ